MAWIESHQELREHPKTKRLCRALGLPRPTVVGYLHFLWWWAYDYAPEGDLSAFTDEDIADAVDWDGDPGAFVAALAQSGFLNDDRHIHDWEDFAQKWIERRQADRERKKNARKTSAGRPPEVLTPSGVTGPDLTGPDLTGPDTPPKPSPHGGKGDAAGAADGKRRGRRNGVSAHDEQHEAASPLPEIELAPVDDQDRSVWNLARENLRGDMSAPNWDQLVGVLEPIGRAPDGGLHLRAPPGSAAVKRARHFVVNALFGAGDRAPANVAIVEGLPGESKHASNRNGAIDG